MSARAKFVEAENHFGAIITILDTKDPLSKERLNEALDATSQIFGFLEAVVIDIEKQKPPLWAFTVLEELHSIRAAIGPAAEERPTVSTASAPEVQRSYSAALASPELQRKAEVFEPPMTVAEPALTVVTPRRRRIRTRMQPAALTSSALPTAPHTATTTPVRSSAPSPALKTAIVNERPIVARRIIIRGSGPSSPNLVVAPRMKTVHAFYLAKNTTINQVEAFVKQIRPSAEPRAERIVPRGDYASFKIRVPEADFDTLMAPEVWPTGVAVNDAIRF